MPTPVIDSIRARLAERQATTGPGLLGLGLVPAPSSPLTDRPFVASGDELLRLSPRTTDPIIP